MNPDPTRLRQQQQQEEEQTATAHQHQNQAARTFDSAEEMIRLDARQITPPESIEERLKESIAQEPKPAPSWWRRLFFKPP